jgi:hypothetical protein
VTESEWIDKLKRARLVLYEALRHQDATQEAARAATEATSKETQTALRAYSEIRDGFDAWLLAEMGVGDELPGD